MKADLWAIAVLTVLAAFVAWQVARLDDLSTDPEQMAAAAANARAARNANALEYSAPVQSAQEFVERPLFWASRRPPEPAPEEEPPPAPQPPPPPPPPLPRDLLLTGVVQVGDEVRALLKDRRETFSLRQGDQHKGWQVKEILPDRVLLGYGASSTELLLFDPPLAPAPVVRPTKRSDAESAESPPPLQSGDATPGKDKK